MTKTERSSRIEELRTLLKEDWKGLHRKYPDQAIFALEDTRVTDAIEKRFEKNGTIKEIRSMNYDFYTGLNSICFEFTPISGSVGLPSPDAFLIIMDNNSKIIGMRDPFDPAQPNPFIPPLPKEGEQPFVLSRPSNIEDLIFRDQELYAVQVRSREFFDKLASGGSGPIKAAVATDGDDYIIYTKCDYATHALCQYKSDRTTDDCGMPDVFEA
jgi:hypothetical protein